MPFVCHGQPRTSVPTMNNGCLIRILASIYVRSYKKPSPVGEGGAKRRMRCPHPCSHYLTASHKQTITHKICRDRRPRLSASLFARSFVGEGCSHLQKAFLREEGGTSYASDGRSLRNFKICAILTVAHSPSVAVGASSLSEGASEMFAAVRLVRAVCLYRRQQATALQT